MTGAAVGSPLPAPLGALRACVVVPARDEQALIASTIEALAAQVEIERADFEVLLVLNRCRDETRARAFGVALRHPGFVLHLLESDADGVGGARRAGMDAACARLFAVGRPQGLIASTDADSTVAEDWLVRQLDAASRGAQAIGGRIELPEVNELPASVLAWRRARAAERHSRVLSAAADGQHAKAEHWQFSGASMALTAEIYRRLGGLEPMVALEDEDLERRLTAAGVTIHRPLDVRVTTSPRTDGRTPRGLAADLTLSSWLHRRSLRAADFELERLLELKGDTVSVIVPARNEAATIGRVLGVLDHLKAAGLLDEVLVVDGGSSDETVRNAQAHDADVVQENDLRPEFGPTRGKGDAMWRGLGATSGDIVVFLDADTVGFDDGYVRGLLGPLFCDPELALVKGAFARPFRVGETVLDHGGGRVTELVARPLLNLLRPELAGFEQPLAGEIAARRWLLEELSFPVGYGIEIAMLLDAADRVGIERLAQVDLGVRQNDHQPLHDLSAMAHAVIVATWRRALGGDAFDAIGIGPLVRPRQGRLTVADVPVEERPSIRSLEVEERRARVAEHG